MPARVRAILPSLIAIVCGCNGETYPSVSCDVAIWTKPQASDSTVFVVGSWDAYRPKGVKAVTSEDGWAVAVLSLPEGEYGYRVVENGVARPNPYEPLSTYRGAEEESLLIVPSCRNPALQITTGETTADGSLSLQGTFLAAHSGPPLDPQSLRVLVDGKAVAGSHLVATPETGAFDWTVRGVSVEKHSITVEAADEAGHLAAEARASVWPSDLPEGTASGAGSPSWKTGLFYQIVVDRYRGDGGAALSPPPSPGSRAGGTLGGVTAEIERGTFDALGVTALWLSPLYLGPEGFWTGRDGHPSEGYHGYWPIENRTVDPRLGGEQALHTLVQTAHAHGLRVLFDLVPNHVHAQNPRHLAHQKDGFFNDGPSACVCGDPGCDWGSHIERCWFTPFLPDVRYEDARAVHAAIDDALFWVKTFDADGVRIDAVPMMPRSLTRRLVTALHESTFPNDSVFTLGEVFVGEGQLGIDTIKYFLGPNSLDSAFDFPLMWALRNTLARESSGFDSVESVLAAEERTLRGSNAVMARMVDNHDTSRFLSEAAHDANKDPWTDPPGEPSDPDVYARHRMALALLFALPGLPVLYYGDEVAIPGGGDPDSRRVMPPEGSISAEQRKTLDLVKRLSSLRRCLPALQGGARLPISFGKDTYVFARDGGNGTSALALFSKARETTSLLVPGGVVPPGPYRDVITGETFSLVGPTLISTLPRTFRFLIPASSPCL